jgi:hypothetical protein
MLFSLFREHIVVIAVHSLTPKLGVRIHWSVSMDPQFP